MLRKHDDLDQFEIGDWCFINNDTYIWLLCPSNMNKDGDMVCLPIYKLVKTDDRHSWEWNGNYAEPTLSPSILNYGEKEPRWHGFLRNGKLETC